MARTANLVIVVATMAVGIVALSFTLRLAPGDDLFLPAGFALAALWGGGAWWAGARLQWDRAASARHVVLGTVLGVGLLGASLVAAVWVARVPVLREPAQELLQHAESGLLLPVLLLTAVNGVAEELFFRGAMYDALPPRVALLVTTLAYTLTTVGSGVALLILAAAVLGAMTGWLRMATSGLVAPVAAHLTWSLGMLLLLPTALTTGR